MVAEITVPVRRTKITVFVEDMMTDLPRTLLKHVGFEDMYVSFMYEDSKYLYKQSS